MPFDKRSVQKGEKKQNAYPAIQWMDNAKQSHK
jgi:hypothetical protein